MTDLAPITEKLAKFVRMFGSDNPNLRAEAWEALVRTLNTFGADFNAEHAGDGALTESELQEVYEAGIKEGERRTEYKLRSQSQAQHNGARPQFQSPRDMAMYCYQRIDDLNDWETEFIINIVVLARRGYPLSIKRQDKLETIYLKLGGRI